MTVDPRDLRIAELERRLRAALARIEELEAEVRELKARLAQNSQNSSRPPSSDGPQVVRQPKRTRSGRRPGGQPGHARHEREQLPSDEVDHVQELEPICCGGCRGKRLRKTSEEPLRQQQTELPPPRPVTTECQRHVFECLDCGATTIAELPDTAQASFGPVLTATVGVMVGQYRHSKRAAQSALEALHGVKLSLGMISKLEHELAAALARPVAEVEELLRQQAILHGDETGWFEGTKDGRHRRAWLWTFAAPLLAAFRIAFSRGSDVAKEMLGPNFTGILTTDRWSGYNWFDLGLRQLCWSHLTRDFQGFIDRGGIGGELAKELMAERDRMFRWWSQVGDETLTRAEFAERMRPVRRRVRRLLEKIAEQAEGKTAGMAREMLPVEEAFWTFVDVEGVEPTNNFAERCIRHAVMYRKTSFGTQSSAGSRFVERILTVVTTLKLQKRDVLDFLTRAVVAHRTGGAPPSLLPQASVA